MTKSKHVLTTCLQVASVRFGFASQLHAHYSGQAVERNPLKPVWHRPLPVVEVAIEDEDRRHHRQH